jgi:hypothetical protein
MNIIELAKQAGFERLGYGVVSTQQGIIVRLDSAAV